MAISLPPLLPVAPSTTPHPLFCFSPEKGRPPIDITNTIMGF